MCPRIARVGPVQGAAHPRGRRRAVSRLRRCRTGTLARTLPGPRPPDLRGPATATGPWKSAAETGAVLGMARAARAPATPALEVVLGSHRRIELVRVNGLLQAVEGDHERLPPHTGAHAAKEPRQLGMLPHPARVHGDGGSPVPRRARARSGGRDRLRCPAARGARDRARRRHRPRLGSPTGPEQAHEKAGPELRPRRSAARSRGGVRRRRLGAPAGHWSGRGYHSAAPHILLHRTNTSRPT